MYTALHTGAGGMIAQQYGMDVVANNLANVNTAGYKRNDIAFADLVYRALPDGTGGTVQVGQGSRIAGTDKHFGQGALESTGRQLDLAIEGSGFYTVQLPDGRFGYTRESVFHKNANGTITTGTGATLFPEMTWPANANKMNVAPNGSVSFQLPDGTLVNGGDLQLVMFPNAKGLESAGDNLFLETQSSGRPTIGTPGDDGRGNIQQGFVERSNVSVVEEMVQMILTQRSFEMNSRVVKTSDEMLRTAVSIRA